MCSHSPLPFREAPNPVLLPTLYHPTFTHQPTILSSSSCLHILTLPLSPHHSHAGTHLILNWTLAPHLLLLFESGVPLSRRSNMFDSLFALLCLITPLSTPTPAATACSLPAPPTSPFPSNTPPPHRLIPDVAHLQPQIRTQKAVASAERRAENANQFFIKKLQTELREIQQSGFTHGGISELLSF